MNSSPTALGHVLHVIYHAKQFVTLTSSNVYLKAKDLVGNRSNDVQHIKPGKVQSVRGGQPGGDDVRVRALAACKQGCNHWHGDEGIEIVFGYKSPAYLQTYVKRIKPSSPQLTNVEDLLPLTSMFDSEYLLFHIEEHITCLAYFAGDAKREQYLESAKQFKLRRAVKTIKNFSVSTESADLDDEHNAANNSAIFTTASMMPQFASGQWPMNYAAAPSG